MRQLGKRQQHVERGAVKRGDRSDLDERGLARDARRRGDGSPPTRRASGCGGRAERGGTRTARRGTGTRRGTRAGARRRHRRRAASRVRAEGGARSSALRFSNFPRSPTGVLSNRTSWRERSSSSRAGASRLAIVRPLDRQHQHPARRHESRRPAAAGDACSRAAARPSARRSASDRLGGTPDAGDVSAVTRQEVGLSRGSVHTRRPGVAARLASPASGTPGAAGPAGARTRR